VEDHETLETSAVVRKLADAVEDKVDNLLANGVVTAGVVIGGIFLAGDQLLGVVELAVGSGANLIDDSRLEVDANAAGDELSSSGLGEESLVGVIRRHVIAVGGLLAIRLDPVLEAEKLPAGVSDLDASLAKVYEEALTHLYSGVVVCFGRGDERWGV